MPIIKLTTTTIAISIINNSKLLKRFSTNHLNIFSDWGIMQSGTNLKETAAYIVK